jgi:hypothetical protein
MGVFSERFDETLQGGSAELYEKLHGFIEYMRSFTGWDSLTSVKAAKDLCLIRDRYSDVIEAIDFYLKEGRDPKGADLRLCSFKKDGLFSKWLAAQEIGWMIHAAEAAASEYNFSTLAECDDLLTFSEPLF